MIPLETNDDETLALGALSWTLGEDKRAERLLALTGLNPETLRDRVDDGLPERCSAT